MVINNLIKATQSMIFSFSLRRWKLALLGVLFLCLGVMSAKAQEDYSGIYYIANIKDGYDYADPNNYYLVPAKGPSQLSAPNLPIDVYFDADVAPYGPPYVKPYVTTYKTGQIDEAIWLIKYDQAGFYYIQHVNSEKYLVFKRRWNSGGTSHRKIVHLETLTPAQLEDKQDSVLFYVFHYDNNDANPFNIRPKKLSLSVHCFLNPAQGNTDSYQGQNQGSSTAYFKGLIGGWNYNNDNGSDLGSQWQLESVTPILTADEVNQTVVVSGLWRNADIRYTLDGTDPTHQSMQCSGGVISIGNARKTVKVRAYFDGVATPISTIIADFFWKEITALSQITDLDERYKLVADIADASGHETIEGFTGSFDGNFHTITGLTQPIFGTLDGGYNADNEMVVCNVILEDVNIGNHEGNTGAIACTAKGNVCIYNCGILSGRVEGTGDTGGLVGLLDCYLAPNSSFARVVNCYSFADITAAGTYAAGIVGNNNYASTGSDLRTAVVNCMFYGDITGGANRYPVYGHEELLNGDGGINNYNYYREEATFDDVDSYDNYNTSWPVKEEYLTRFEYYRNIFNCNRNLFAFYVSGKSYSDPDHAAARRKMAKWVLDPSVAKYPILKPWGKYPSIINPDMEKIWDNQTDPSNPHWVYRAATPGEEGDIPYQGKKLGELSVTVKSGTHPRLSSFDLNATQYADKNTTLYILDMDTLNHDYGYCKVQLPYYNELFGNPNGFNHYEKYCANYTDSIVTGWKVTAVTGSGSITYHNFEAHWEHGYNFADRYCTDKDLYAVSKRVFAQGGYYYVPEGVTAITIEAYWGRAVYVHNADHSVDRVDLGGSAFSPAGTYDALFNGQTVRTSIKNAIAQLTNEGSGASALTVYDQAIVLVGNVQHKNGDDQTTLGWNSSSGTWAEKNKPYTLTSVDLDFDNEPDYCLQLQWGRATTRVNIHPVRFDFLPIPSLGMAIRKNHDFLYAIGIFIPRGHFEVTETAFMHTGQFEYENNSDYRKEEAPLILNGGEYEQFVSSRKWDKSYGALSSTKYIILGGHVWMKEFTPGKHTDCDAATRHCAVSVMGGEYAKRFCLSGVFLKSGHTYNEPDNPHCYTNGGKFGTISGAGMEDIKGDVTFEIDHSLIKEFYGGGLNAARFITGSIHVTINNSMVGKYCGGPFTGDMEADTKVTTNAFNTIFGYFYGGGNGGTNFSRINLGIIDKNGW